MTAIWLRRISRRPDERYWISTTLSDSKRAHPLEGSCQEVKLPPYTPFAFFFAEVCCMAPALSFAVSDAPVSSMDSVAVTSKRRTTHPSGSRLFEVSLTSQTSAPGASAPQKTFGTLSCPIVMFTDFWLPSGSSLLVAHNRGVANWASELLAVSKRLKSGLISSLA
jgi:hypothetical protein